MTLKVPYLLHKNLEIESFREGHESITHIIKYIIYILILSLSNLHTHLQTQLQGSKIKVLSKIFGIK